MCELKALCKKLYGMRCGKDKNSLRCLKAKGDNSRLIDFQLRKDDLEKIRKFNRYEFAPLQRSYNELFWFPNEELGECVELRQRKGERN